MKTIQLIPLALLTLLSLNACSNDDPNPVNEEEMITTVEATLKAGDTEISLKSRDLDGDGPNAPVVTVSGNLKVNTTYAGSLKISNETVSPSINLNPEIISEGDEHQFFYQAPLSIGSFQYVDKDVNGKPLGILFTLTTAKNPSTGNITITLKHLPIKGAPGVAEGDITNAGGATDALVTFPVAVVN